MDDAIGDRYLIKGILAALKPFEIIEANSGEAGLRLAGLRQPHVIFLDLGLPDMTGFDVLERLKSDERTTRIPVIVHTSKALDPEERGRLAQKSVAIIGKGSKSPRRQLPRFESHFARLACNCTRLKRRRNHKNGDGIRELILLVDDDPPKRYTLARTLSRAGFLVQEAGTGAEALRLVASRPDLVILDVKLPDISGLEVCRRIKSDPTTRAIPVLHISTTFVHLEDKIQGLDSGADGYLTNGPSRWS